MKKITIEIEPLGQVTKTKTTCAATLYHALRRYIMDRDYLSDEYYINNYKIK